MKMHNSLRKCPLYFYFIFTSSFKKAISQDMEFRVGIVIGASLWLMTEQQHPDHQMCTSLTDIAEPCGCMLSPETFDLICGSDAHTYLNMCFLSCRVTVENIVVDVAHEGACTQESRCSCPARYDPVCGTDSLTYSNECVFNCLMRNNKRHKVLHTGECESAEVINLNTDEPENENKKSGNCCCNSNLRRLRTRFGNNGKRDSQSSCGCGCRHERNTSQKPQPAKQTAQPPSCPFNNPPSIQPRTRLNQGCPDQQQPRSLTDLEEEQKSKRCVCAMTHRPVCGNNKKTYSNFCVLFCTAKKDPSVEFQHWGVCGRPQKTPYDDN